MGSRYPEEFDRPRPADDRDTEVDPEEGHEWEAIVVVLMQRMGVTRLLLGRDEVRFAADRRMSVRQGADGVNIQLES
jgi:hypothetical protein